MPTTAEVSVSAHLRKMSPDVRPIVEAARGMVMAIAPNANEIPYQSRPPRAASAMWKIRSLRHRRRQRSRGWHLSHALDPLLLPRSGAR